jgi:DNA-binding CsgD family transcriptional regulator
MSTSERPKPSPTPIADATTESDGSVDVLDAYLTAQQMQIHLRREKVKDLFARRRNITEIAEILQVSRWTISDDIQAIKREIAHTLTTQTAMDVATNTIMFGEVLERSVFQMMSFKRRINPTTGKEEVYDPLEPMERIACANTLLKIRDVTIKQLQKLDVVYKAPERAEVRHVAMQKMAELPVAVLNEIAEMRDEDTILRTLTKHLGADLAAQLVGAPRRDISLLAAAEHVDVTDVTGDAA